MLLTKKVEHAEDTFCYRDYVSEMSKLKHIYVTGLILLSVLKTTKHTKLYPTSYTLLHQASRGEGKNCLRKRKDILVSDCDLEQCFFIILP